MKIDQNNLHKASERVLSSNVFTYSMFALVFILTSFLSFSFIYHHFSGNTFITTIKLYSYQTMFKLIVLLIMYFVFDGLRLFYVLKTLEVKIKFKHIFKLVFINMFISNITPFATGGGFVQIYFLNKEGVSLSDAIAATSIRTTIATAFLIIVTPIVLIIEKNLFHMFTFSGSKVFFIFTLGYIIMFYAIYKMINKTEKIKKITYKFLYFLQSKQIISSNKFKKLISRSFKEIDAFTQSIKAFFKGNPKNIFLSIASMLLFLFSFFVFSVILITGLNYHISPITIISFQIIITFFMYFTPTPGATVFAEASYIAVFSNYIKNSDLLVLTFAWRFFTIYVGMIIGAVIFYMEMICTNFKKANR
ncbi:lysylphosphatidylglycerol synthase transmembrane domain-containing protein [Caloranaerobacter sp. TR13]|uniref:lysylphosphatidylglycerol synthase transmembrane domain-containing protein n=1 Tax=Caloranaerobacter sp. TR13 TaxID=1302151 RepID=UPI0013792064|nr:lysylphosphatidylglycerol synthase transmembrane domain-containing protein [Caloranaerobacter sp. TR13]